MPKASLHFTLPEEELEFTDAVEGRAAKSLIWDIDQHCRSLIKYSESASEETRVFAESIREMIHQSDVTLE